MSFVVGLCESLPDSKRYRKFHRSPAYLVGCMDIFIYGIYKENFVSSRENSVTGLVAQYLRERNIGTNTFESLEIPGQGVKEPDFTVRNEGTFYGEAKWSKNYNQGIVEATEYHQAPKSNGTFVIAYPEELKKEMQQQRLTADVEDVLGDYEFSVTF